MANAPAQTRLNALATKMARLKAHKEKLAALEAEIKNQVMDLLEDAEVTTVDCPKGRFQLRNRKTFKFEAADMKQIKALKADLKEFEDDAKERAVVLEDAEIAFTAAKKLLV